VIGLALAVPVALHMLPSIRARRREEAARRHTKQLTRESA
jgi:hypothetical protein